MSTPCVITVSYTHLRSNELLGPYERVYAFDEEISRNQPNLYEACLLYTSRCV